MSRYEPANLPDLGLFGPLSHGKQPDKERKKRERNTHASKQTNKQPNLGLVDKYVDQLFLGDNVYLSFFCRYSLELPQ